MSVFDNTFWLNIRIKHSTSYYFYYRIATSGITGVNNLIVPPMCRVFLSTTFSVPNSAWTDVTHTTSNSTEDFDTDGMLTLSSSASNMTVQTAGMYSCTAQASFTLNGSGIRAARILRRRSGSDTCVAVELQTPSTTTETIISLAGYIECAVSDQLILNVLQNSGAALNLLASTAFQLNSLSAAWAGRTS
jgi:hypothetical protein